MRLCKFGQDPPIGSGDRVQTRSYADVDGNICPISNANGETVRIEMLIPAFSSLFRQVVRPHTLLPVTFGLHNRLK